MKKIAKFCFTASIVVFFVTCKKKNTTVSYTPSCSGTKSYINNVAPLLQSYCTSCHNTYSSYTSVKNSASSIRSSIVNGSMPKNSTLTEDQKNSIVCWIDAGAPNN
jgi:hypothetical protein